MEQGLIPIGPQGKQFNQGFSLLERVDNRLPCPDPIPTPMFRPGGNDPKRVIEL
jgi:hypothetical protein